MLTCTGVPGVLAALVLAFLSNLFGSITHYGSGQVRSVCFG
jgi:divalent anion:Na+ symporter, DASS family